MNVSSTKRELVARALRVHGPELRRFVARRVAAPHVDDVLQLAALRAMERSESVTHPEAVTAWLYRIHRNLIVDTYRTAATEAKYVDGSAELPEPGTGSDTDSCTCSVIQAGRLRPAYSEILTLVDSGGLELTDAAERLQISTNNATVRLHRARKALRQSMYEHCGVRSPQECASCRCVEDACCAA